MTLTEWRQLILLKLGLDIPFTLKWYDNSVTLSRPLVTSSLIL
jgi:hypothetical protein